MIKRVKTIDQLDLENRLVFVRLDLNVPMKDGVITSDARIRATLPTIKALRKAGGKLGLASHLGRPKGQPNAEFSLEPVGGRLSELLDMEVFFTEDCIGDSVRAVVPQLEAGGVMLLENLRFHAGEEGNDPEFSTALGRPFDVYVNDAFGACHRAHASIVGMVGAFHERGAGLLLDQEVSGLRTLLEKPGKPFVAIIGGAKVADKIGVLNSLLGRANTICIGGAMAYTFLKARGEEIGLSKWEGDKLPVAVEFMKKARERNVELVFPSDHVVAEVFDEKAGHKIVGADEIPEGMMALDIGPQTRAQIKRIVENSATVFWNGPMGVFEWDAFAQGTLDVAKAVASSKAYSVVGGGDSVAALEKAGVVDKISHVSTGGGASLEYLQHETLPGIQALQGLL